MKLISSAAFILAASVAVSSQASAADTADYSQEQIASAFDVAFGVAVTSRYMSRGTALSKGPALQGYIEPSYGIFYAGAWFSTITGDLGGVVSEDDIELDLYLGIRPEFGNLSLDIGYARYLYDQSGDCCGEFYAKATYAFNDTFSAGGEIYFDPNSDATYGVLNGSIALPHDFSFSAAVGTYLDSKSDDVVDWNAGISYTFNDLVTLDGRYHDSNVDPARFVVSISFDTSWSALRSR